MAKTVTNETRDFFFLIIVQVKNCNLKWFLWHNLYEKGREIKQTQIFENNMYVLISNKTEDPSVLAASEDYKNIKAKFLKNLKNFKKTKEC